MVNRLDNDNPGTCTVTWEISNKCNYSCWYCPEYLHSGTDGWPDLEKSLDFFEILSSRNKNVDISLIGGEPTLWPKLTEFLKRLPENVRAEVVTNGSRTIAWWERTKPYLDKVVFTFHPNTAREEHVFSVAKMLDLSGVETHVLLMLDPPHEDRLHDLAAKLKDNGIEYQFKAIFPNFGPNMMDYTQEQKDTIVKDRFSVKRNKPTTKPSKVIIDGGPTIVASTLLVEKANRFQGFSCLVGSKRFHITYEKKIFAGSCFSKYLGTLYDPVILDEPIICPKEICNCLDDIRVTKWRND